MAPGLTLDVDAWGPSEWNRFLQIPGTELTSTLDAALTIVEPHAELVNVRVGLQPDNEDFDPILLQPEYVQDVAIVVGLISVLMREDSPGDR